MCTIHQNQFKPQLDRQWAYLVYAGLWWEPLRGDLDAYMERVNEQVSGTIGVKLYKGHARVVTRSSPNAVYDASLASFSQSGGLFSQAASPGSSSCGRCSRGWPGACVTADATRVGLQWPSTATVQDPRIRRLAGGKWYLRKRAAGKRPRTPAAARRATLGPRSASASALAATAARRRRVGD